MSLTREMPASQVEQLRQAPVHEVLLELTRAARDAKMLKTPEFKKLVAYLLEMADGRDRREPWTTKSGSARRVPKLRVALEECFGVYADLHWFTLNKITNRSGQPLTGLFERIAASLWRVTEDDFAALLTALLAPAPDTALIRFLADRDGRIKGLGVEAFSRLAFAFRRDLFFTLPKPWAETSGALGFIGNDLRRYCGLCRNMRAVCDRLGVQDDVRGAVLQTLITRPKPPAVLLESLHEAMGPSLAKFSALDPSAGFKVKGTEDDPDSLPIEFARNAIRMRRGRRDLREQLRRAYGDRCAISGPCLPDLLEVAYVVPYPSGDVHAAPNALLLRSDLHTLWDLNLIGIEPTNGRVAVAPRLSDTPYAKLAGRSLLKRSTAPVDPAGLGERWRMYANAHDVKSGAGRVAPAPAVKRPAPAQEKAAELPERTGREAPTRLPERAPAETRDAVSTDSASRSGEA